MRRVKPRRDEKTAPARSIVWEEKLRKESAGKRCGCVAAQ